MRLTIAIILIGLAAYVTAQTSGRPHFEEHGDGNGQEKHKKCDHSSPVPPASRARRHDIGQHGGQNVPGLSQDPSSVSGPPKTQNQGQSQPKLQLPGQSLQQSQNPLKVGEPKPDAQVPSTQSDNKDAPKPRSRRQNDVQLVLESQQSNLFNGQAPNNPIDGSSEDSDEINGDRKKRQADLSSESSKDSDDIDENKSVQVIEQVNRKKRQDNVGQPPKVSNKKEDSSSADSSDENNEQPSDPINPIPKRSRRQQPDQTDSSEDGTQDNSDSSSSETQDNDTAVNGSPSRDSPNEESEQVNDQPAFHLANDAESETESESNEPNTN